VVDLVEDISALFIMTPSNRLLNRVVLVEHSPRSVVQTIQKQPSLRV